MKSLYQNIMRSRFSDWLVYVLFAAIFFMLIWPSLPPSSAATTENTDTEMVSETRSRIKSPFTDLLPVPGHTGLLSKVAILGSGLVQPEFFESKIKIRGPGMKLSELERAIPHVSANPVADSLRMRKWRSKYGSFVSDQSPDRYPIPEEAKPWLIERGPSGARNSRDEVEIDALLRDYASFFASGDNSGIPRDGMETTAALPYSLRDSNREPLSLPLQAPRIVVDKSIRNLILYDGDREVRRYGISLGPSPQGDKQIRGDGKTPEGNYFVSSKNPYSKFHLNLGISYPNAEDAARGFRAGLISQSEYRAIVQAERAGRQPPWNTRLGGAIVIHGEDVTNGDWTQGCVGLRDEDMTELFEIIAVGTPIVIRW